ncbi:hypothetical protein GCM10023169_32410 [Georgenia halophila]|uniref:Pentapeptide repeat-containing protein n=1 Tax=Georgenia halophila TaxID=620889 RepID=A0ABP8LHD5_9MICO
MPEPDVAAHLMPSSPADLDAGSTLTGVDLSGAVLSGAELDEVQVEASALERMRAAGATWQHTVLVDCRLDGTDLANLRAPGLSLVRCSLREVRLVGGQLTRARLRSVRIEGGAANLTGWQDATWQHVVLRGCDLREADLTGASLTDVLLQDCDLTGAQLSGLRCERVRLSGCRLGGIGGVEGLRGASIGEPDAYELLPAMARSLGIRIESA